MTTEPIVHPTTDLSQLVKPGSPVYGCTYSCYGQVDHTPEQALEKYNKKYGCDPAEIFTYKRSFWLGPIPGGVS